MKKLVELLISTGLTPSLSKVVAYFIESKGEDIFSREIEKAKDLRQPEVSLAISNLIKKKWIAEVDEKTAGATGRPSRSTKSSTEIYWMTWHRNMEQDVNKWKDLITEIRAMMVVKESVQPETPHVMGKQQSLDHLSL